MNSFRYVRASDVSEALAAFAQEHSAKWLAGGTNLIDLMKERIEQPETLIDINALPLGGIELHADRLEIGATTRMSELAQDERVRSEFPAIAQALEESASRQLRNMASIGGNLMQRTRCAYFRDHATPCNKRVPGEGCSAIGGWTRGHAILGTSDACINVHPSDLAVALCAMDATVRIANAEGSRDVAVDEFYVLPAARPDVDTVLQPGDLIVSVSVPRRSWFTGSRYYKLRDRSSYEFALVSAAVAADMRDGVPAEIAIALGGVAPKPWRARAAERVLRGHRPDSRLLAEAADAELAQARSYGENAFKMPLVRNLIRRAVGEVTGCA